MIEITIRVPDELGKRLTRVQDQIPAMLERVLDEQTIVQHAISADEQEILETLTQNPSPQTILALKPSEELQARVSELLARHKQAKLTRAEELELDRYLYLEHWIRLAKAHAYQQLAHAE